VSPSILKIEVLPLTTFDFVTSCSSDPYFRRVDLIVSELMGNIGDNEDMVTTISQIRARMLSPRGRCIPLRIHQFLAPITSERLWNAVRDSRVQGSARAYDFEGIQAYYDAIIPARCHLSDPVRTNTFDFEVPSSLIGEYRRYSSWRMSRTAALHGFKTWFVADVAPGVVLDLDPPGPTGVPERDRDMAEWDYSRRNVSDCWKHGFLSLPDPIAVHEGDFVNVSFCRDHGTTGIVRYSVDGRVVGTDHKNDTLIQQSVRFDMPFSGNNPVVSADAPLPIESDLAATRPTPSSLAQQ
jgi:protein arginine N-methyltransferase 1